MILDPNITHASACGTSAPLVPITPILLLGFAVCYIGLRARWVSPSAQAACSRPLRQPDFAISSPGQPNPGVDFVKLCNGALHARRVQPHIVTTCQNRGYRLKTAPIVQSPVKMPPQRLVACQYGSVPSDDRQRHSGYRPGQGVWLCAVCLLLLRR